MKRLTTYLTEDFKISHNTSIYHINPKTKEDLTQIIKNITHKYVEQYVDLRHVDVSEIDDFSHLFQSPRFSDRTIDISTWKMHNATSLVSMFYMCGAKKIILPETLNCPKVTTMSSMFFSCSRLEEIVNIENFCVPNVKNIDFIFDSCSKLTSLDLSKWRLSNIEDAMCAFDGCESLETLNLGNISDEAKQTIRNSSDVFNNCKEQIIPRWYYND